MIEHPCVQLSPAWWELRRGRPTASDFDMILTPARGERSGSRPRYIGQLIGSLLPGWHPDAMTERPMNPAMRHGVDCEPEARQFYELTTGRQTRQVGLCTTDDGRFGMSPDGLVVGERGGLELKCPQPQTHHDYLVRGGLPRAYRCQVHGQLVVAEGALDWIDFVSYCRDQDPLVVRVVWGEFTDKLKAALEEFWGEYTAILSGLYGRAFRTRADVEGLLGRKVA